MKGVVYSSLLLMDRKCQDNGAFHLDYLKARKTTVLAFGVFLTPLFFSQNAKSDESPLTRSTGLLKLQETIPVSPTCSLGESIKALQLIRVLRSMA